MPDKNVPKPSDDPRARGFDGWIPFQNKTAHAFAADSRRPSTQVRECLHTWRPPWRMVSALRQALPTTAVGQTRLRSRYQLSLVKHRIKRSRIFFCASQPPAAAAAITPRALAVPPSAPLRAAKVAAAPALVPVEAPVVAQPQQQLSPSTCCRSHASAACKIISSYSVSKGPRRNEGCRQHERQTPLTPPEGASVHKPVSQTTAISPLYHPPVDIIPPLDWGSPMLAFISG